MRLGLALVLCLLGCKERAPHLALECKFHQDCQPTGLGPDCCDTCRPQVGNVGSLSAFTAWCAAHPPAGCPKIDCQAPDFTAMCERERCIAKPGIHPL